MQHLDAALAAACQSLRILSFLSTGLPGPAPHCRLGKSTASLAWPQHWWQNIFFDIGTQVGERCCQTSIVSERMHATPAWEVCRMIASPL